jgi:hypothetical protein
MSRTIRRFRPLGRTAPPGAADKESRIMKYLLTIYGNEAIWDSFSRRDIAALIKDTDAHNAKLMASGEMLSAYGVAEQSRATQVTVAEGETVVTDGPYIEAKEYIGSFYVVDVDSEERAIEIAAEMPSAKYRQIEVRPILHEAPGNCETP